MMFRRPAFFAPLCAVLLSLASPFLATAATSAPAPVSVSGRLGLDGLSIQGTDTHGVLTETIAIAHPSAAKALRITVPGRVALVHQVQANLPNRAAIAADDVVLVRLTVRSGGAPDSRVQGQLLIQDHTANHRSLGSRPVEAGAAWEEIEFLVPIKKAYFRNELSFALFLGGAAQTVDLARFEVWNLGPRPDDATLARLRAAALIHHDFEGDYALLAEPASATTTPSAAQITGTLPAGWEDDSAWADVTATYGPAPSNPFAGQKSLRVEIPGIRSGRVQFRLPQLVIDPAYQLRLRVATRSPTSTPVTVALRQRGEPYRVYWQTTLPAAPEWGISEALAAVPTADADAILLFSVANPGILELDDLSLTYLTPAQALGNRSFAGNLLPASSLPLGLVAPWTPGGNGIPATAYVADPAMPGPSGLPSLRLTPFTDRGRPVAQITAPFEGRPASPHTFSFWARAAHPGHSVSIRVGPPTETLYHAPWQKIVTLTEDWQRYHFTVSLPPAPDGFYLARINTHEAGTVWLDQLMVEATDHPTDFVPVSPVELTAAATAPYGLGFAETPLPFTVSAHGDLASLHQVSVTVRDLYDQVRDLPPLTPRASGEKLLTFAGALPATLDLPALGSFLLEFTARDAAGKALSKPAELLLHRVRPPRHLGRDAPDSAFGTHIFPTPAEATMAKALGFNWVRLNYKLNWSRVEPRPGVWSWESLDAELATYRAQNLSILGYLGGVPARASHAQPDWKSWWRNTAAVREDHLDDWQEYARRLFERYGRTIAAFETWNEPFLPGFFPVAVEQGTAVRGSATLFHQMNRRVRAAATATKLTAPIYWNLGSAYGPSELAFDQENVALGTAALMDGFTFHRYTNSPLAVPGDQFARDTATLATTLGDLAARGGGLINTEGGSSNDLFNLYRHAPLAHLRARSDQQAANLARYYLSNFAAGVRRVFIYAFFSEDDWVPRYSYLNIDGQLSAAAPAISQLAWQLEDLRFARATTLVDAVHALHFTVAGSPDSVVVLNSLGRRPVSLTSLPPGTVLTDLYGNTPALPAALGVGLLYLRGPGLTPESLSPHLSR